MTLTTRIIPCFDEKDCKRRPQPLCGEDAQIKDSAVR